LFRLEKERLDAFYEPEREEHQHYDALVQETLDLRSMVEGEARSFMGGAGAATTTATNRETRSSTLENMTMD
jgi:hypothetical protein